MSPKNQTRVHDHLFVCHLKLEEFLYLVSSHLKRRPTSKQSHFTKLTLKTSKYRRHWCIRNGVSWTKLESFHCIRYMVKKVCTEFIDGSFIRLRPTIFMCIPRSYLLIYVPHIISPRIITYFPNSTLHILMTILQWSWSM